MRNQGFSLVELSIVLVILGLLVGGVLSGQSLIHAAELRAITTEETKWVAAANSFRDKYLALPGDMNNAVSFWGQSTTGCNDDGGLSSPDKTCNGNGDGLVKFCAGATAYSCKEPFWFWQELGLSGLIEGKYAGNADQNSTHTTPGLNVPGSKYPNGQWSIDNQNIVGGNNYWVTMDYGNFFSFGPYSPSVVSSVGGNLKPEDAWNIDTKMDDGKPMTGKVIGTSNNNGYTTIYDSLCNTAANSSDFSATYILSLTTPTCALKFVRQF